MRRKEELTEVETGRCGSVRVVAKTETEMSQDGGVISSAGRGSCSCSCRERSRRKDREW